MADDNESRASELRDLHGFLGLIDPGIEKILAKLDSEPKGNVIDELDEDYEIDILLETRDIIFRHAKAKLEKSSHVEAGDAATNDSDHEVRTIETEINAMTLVNRRVKHRAIEDIILLMNYISELTDFFPYKIVKKGKGICYVKSGTIKKFVVKEKNDENNADSSSGGSDVSDDEDGVHEASEAPERMLDANETASVDKPEHAEARAATELNTVAPHVTEIEGDVQADNDSDKTTRVTGDSTSGKGKKLNTIAKSSEQPLVENPNELTDSVSLCHVCGCTGECSKQQRSVQADLAGSRKSNVEPRIKGKTMATQTESDFIIFSQPIPDEQIGIESVLTELDERSGKVEDKVDGVVKEMTYLKEKIGSLQKWRAEEARRADARNKENSALHESTKANQLSLIQEVKWLRDIVTKADLTNDANRGAKESDPGVRMKGSANPASRPVKPTGSDTYDSIWNIENSNTAKVASNQANSRAPSSRNGPTAGMNTRPDQGKTNMNSALGKYLAQLKAVNTVTNRAIDGRRLVPGQDQNPTMTGMVGEQGAKQANGHMNRPSYPANGIGSASSGYGASSNLLDLSEYRGDRRAAAVAVTDDRPYRMQYPAVPGADAVPVALNSDGKPVQWADEISDNEMANFYKDQVASSSKNMNASGASEQSGGARSRQNAAGAGQSATNNASQETTMNDQLTTGDKMVSGNDAVITIDGTNDDTTDNSYAGVAGEGDWSPPVRSNKRKWEMRDKKPPLKGVDQQPHREIYVQGISTDGFKSKEEVVTMVRDYCRFEGVIPGQAVVIPVKDDDTQTGCKVTVRASDANKLMTDDFWPNGIFARPWRPKPKGNDNAKEKRDNNENDQPK